MIKISRNDLKAFGRVIHAISIAIADDPDEAIKRIQDALTIPSEVESVSRNIDEDRVQSVRLFVLAAEMSKDELIVFLSQFNGDELRTIIRNHRLTATKLKSVTSLTEYIADQAKKRSTDVFIDHSAE